MGTGNGAQHGRGEAWRWPRRNCRLATRPWSHQLHGSLIRELRGTRVAARPGPRPRSEGRCTGGHGGTIHFRYCGIPQYRKSVDRTPDYMLASSYIFFEMDRMARVMMPVTRLTGKLWGGRHVNPTQTIRRVPGFTRIIEASFGCDGTDSTPRLRPRHHFRPHRKGLRHQRVLDRTGKLTL